jgi:hypothetical protein
MKLSHFNVAKHRIPMRAEGYAPRNSVFLATLVGVAGLLLFWPVAISTAGAPEQKSPAGTIVPGANESHTPTPDDINRWIAELSHDAFTVRQAAAARLLAAGMAARDALLAIADGPEPETRAAARRLVALIDQSEFNRRLEAFAADTDGRQKLTLPGWSEYQKLVGGDPVARGLFVDMQRHEGALFSAVFGVSSRPAEEVWESRLTRLARWQTPTVDRNPVPPLASCAAIVFLASVPEMNVSETAALNVEGLIQRSPIHEALQSAQQDAVRRIVTSWILNCPNPNEEILLRRLNLMSTLNLEGALPLALAIVGGDTKYAHVQPLTRSMAALAVGQFGNRAHIERLEPLLDDAAVCQQLQGQLPGQPATAVQVRDVALVVMLSLTDQRPADYGYVNARLQQPRSFLLPSLFRENDKQRDEAVAKWRAWRSAQKAAGPSNEKSKTTESAPPKK